MGCHTWFYRKIERSQEEAKSNCLKGLRHSRNLAWKIYRRPTSYYGINWVGEFNAKVDLYKNKQLNYIKLLNRQIRMVENNLCKEAIWNHQYDKELTEYVKGKGLFIEDTKFHDEFRRHSYPEDKLFSLKETLDYINNPDNQCVTYDWTEKRLREFWYKYPEGMIEFG
jgi:hypothetical protein